jgi:hypothetical protein
MLDVPVGAIIAQDPGMGDVCSYEGAETGTDTAESAEGDKAGRAFHHTLDVLKGFKGLGLLCGALTGHKSTLKYKVKGKFSLVQGFGEKFIKFSIALTAYVQKKAAR